MKTNILKKTIERNGSNGRFVGDIFIDLDNLTIITGINKKTDKTYSGFKDIDELYKRSILAENLLDQTLDELSKQKKEIPISIIDKFKQRGFKG